MSTILFANKVPFDEVDGADPNCRARREELFRISQIRGEYPQFFVSDTSSGHTVFLCDRHEFFQANEEGELASILSSAGVVEDARHDGKPVAAPRPQPSRTSVKKVVALGATGTIETGAPAGGNKQLISMWQNLDKRNNG